MCKWLRGMFKRTHKEEVKNEERDLTDNIDPGKKDDFGIVPKKYLENTKDLWYPKANRLGFGSMRTRGEYKKGYPRGAVIHFTAGRARPAPVGSTRKNYPTSNFFMGIKSMESAVEDQSYCYFINDQGGDIHQAFPLNRWGYHAGPSFWEGIGEGVSDDLVGIENQSAGKLEKVKEGVYKAYFTNIKEGDKYFSESEVRHVKSKDNVQSGTYHKFTGAQERGLIELLLWLKANNPSVFSFDLVLGHDEVAPKRKNDPGGALSMTMPEFRELLKKEYKERYGA